jgi:hypothetical protein
MSTMSADEIYERHIKPLPVAERLRLLAVMADDLAHQPTDIAQRPQRSIMELHGLGKEIWQGIDAQEYVNELREEWDHHWC